MHKLIYCLWRKPEQGENAFRDWLISELALALVQRDVTRVRIQVVDCDVVLASHKRLCSSGALPDAVVSVYLVGGGQDFDDAKIRIDKALVNHCSQSECYQVEEAEPLENLSHQTVSGERVYGYCQVAFLQRPARLSEQQWLELWQAQHTQVAIDTQATFGYRQNRVLKVFSEPSRVIHAIVEENFPPEAMSSDHAFYGASTDSQLQARMSTMMESCARFIDFDKIDVVPMSEYVFQP